MTNLKLYGVVGRASSWEVKVEDSTAELLEVNSLLDIGKECYELKSMIEQEDLFMLNLCTAKSRSFLIIEKGLGLMTNRT